MLIGLFGSIRRSQFSGNCESSEILRPKIFPRQWKSQKKSLIEDNERKGKEVIFENIFCSKEKRRSKNAIAICQKLMVLKQMCMYANKSDRNVDS